MQKEICELINNDVLAITNQVAGISLTQSQPVDIHEAYTLSLSANGSYNLNLCLHADKKTLEKIAANMKRSPAAGDEVQMYVIEFFNILGGRIVSRINRVYQQSARFSPPELSDCKMGKACCEENCFSLHYGFSDGSVKVSGNFEMYQ